MALATLRKVTVAGLLLVACGQVLAQNPHTSNGKNCGPWLATAPLSERIRQIETCKSLHIGKAMKLAKEYRDGANGMPRDWAQAARWFGDAVQRGAASPENSYGKLLGQEAQRELIALLQIGGPGLPQDIYQAWRLANDAHKPNIRPGLWELTVQNTYNGRPNESENGVRTQCFDPQAVEASSPFSIWGKAITQDRQGCRIEMLKTHRVISEMRFNCDLMAREGWSSAGTLRVVSDGDSAEATAIFTSQPGGMRGKQVTKGRRIGDC